MVKEIGSNYNLAKTKKHKKQFTVATSVNLSLWSKKFVTCSEF